MTDRDHPLLRDFSDFFEHSLCGHAVLDSAGRFVLCNGPLARWLGYPADELVGRAFNEFLSAGGRIYHETHLAPLLKMQGYYAEVSLDLLCQDGTRLPAQVNAIQRQCGEGNGFLFTRLTVLLARERQVYESNLRQAREAAESSLLDEREAAVLREQFIAVLGHDLRNPLSAITMGAGLLAESSLPEREHSLVEVITSSASRMNELVGNLMDFARFRLGGGVALTRRTVDLDKVFHEVIAELRTGHPDRLIHSHLAIGRPVDCDPARLSQILSNLLANALTHGVIDQPVCVTSVLTADSVLLTVSNRGAAIPPEVIGSLFMPFTREETRSSQNGLGLGLYIAHEVAKAHGGSLSVTSSAASTDFSFRMPVAG